MFGRNRNSDFDYRLVTKEEFDSIDLPSGYQYMGDEEALHEICSSSCICEPRFEVYSNSKNIHHNEIANYITAENNRMLKEVLEKLDGIESEDILKLLQSMKEK